MVKAKQSLGSNKQSNRLLCVEGLDVSFGNTHAVKGIDLQVDAGRTLAIVGESGSGKSVSALSILGLMGAAGGTVNAGKILFNSSNGTHDLLQLSQKQLRKIRGNEIAMIFQEPMTSLDPVFTIADQIGEVLMLHQGLSKKEAYSEAKGLLERVRLPDAQEMLTRYPHQLSGGMRQRVMIAMALACRPSLLIADEPTTALDVTIQAQILTLIRDLQQETGMGILFITHDMGVVAEIADDVVVMLKGEKVEDGSVKTIFSNPKTPYTKALLAAVPKLGSMRGVTVPQPMPILDASEGSILKVAKEVVKSTARYDEPPLISVDNLSVRFDLKGGLLGRVVGSVHAVENVSFPIFAGETVALVGESGSGKSTIGRTIQQLQAISEGDIVFAGQSYSKMSRRERLALRRRVQYVFQDPFASLDPRKTVGFSIAEPIRTHGLMKGQKEIDARVASLLERVGLPAAYADRYPHEFSGGQRQRICIARALSVKPELIIADEALSALDVSVQAQIINLLMELQQSENLAFLFISHDMAVVERMSHRVAVLYLGQIVEIGTRQQIFENPQHPYTKRLLDAVPIADPLQRRDVAIETSQPISRIRRKGVEPRHLIYTEIEPGHLIGRTINEIAQTEKAIQA